MFSARHSFVDMKECTLIKNKNLPKIGVVCQNAKRLFLVYIYIYIYIIFFCFLVVLFFVACVFVLVFCKKAPKGYFPAILEVFCLFCSPKRPVFKILLFFLFCFFSGFPFVFPFKTPFYPFAFWPSAPFWKTLIFLVSLSFLFLPFPFLMFACFFQTNFPTIPFLKPKLLSFWLFIYFICCSCFCFHCVCFSLSVFMLALFLVFFCFCFVFCFCLLSCFAFSLF